jgi:hypothetical protein
MKKIQSKMPLVIDVMNSSKGRLVILALTIALFVLSAGAPNASISIGK